MKKEDKQELIQYINCGVKYLKKAEELFSCHSYTLALEKYASALNFFEMAKLFERERGENRRSVSLKGRINFCEQRIQEISQMQKSSEK